MLTIQWNYPISRMAHNEVCIGTAMLDGQPVLSGVKWSITPWDVASGVIDVGRFRVIGQSGGSFAVTVSIPGKGEYTSIGNVIAPPAPTKKGTPALTWKRHRDDIQVWATDFYYNTKPEMVPEIARRFDCLVSGKTEFADVLKINPSAILCPYTLEFSVILDDPGHPEEVEDLDGESITVMRGGNTPNLQSIYMQDLLAWAHVQKLSTVQIESMFLHGTDGKRVLTAIWPPTGVPNRNVGDPRDANWRKYQLDRFTRMSKQPMVRALFIDEFGSNQVNAKFKLGAGGSSLALAGIIAAEVSLISLIQQAIYPCQLVVNTANYMFQDDIDIAHAALGVHMEQANYPMNLDWWNTTWNYIDKLVASGVLVNLTSPFQFGEYESQKDSKGNHMDTIRGKLLELAAYFMCVTDPALLAFHVENGDWSKYTIVSNWIAQIDSGIGRAIEPRSKIAGTHIFQRRFKNGLVLVNPIADRLPPDYGALTTVLLPNDRKYGLISSNGTVGAQVKSINLRCPEAAIFKVIP